MYRTSFVAGLAALLLPLCVFAGPVDINSADAKTIAKELKGVGLSRAQAIVEYREGLRRLRVTATATNQTRLYRVFDRFAASLA